MGEYGEGGGREEKYKSETGSESEADNTGDSSSDTEEDLGTDKEYDLDGSLDLSEADKYDFDGSLDLSEADKYDFDGSLDFSEMEKNEKDKNDDQNEEYNKEDYVENIESQSISTVLSSEIEEIEGNMEQQEQEEEIEIRPEEYQDDTEPIVNTNEIEFIKDVEDLAEYAREIKAEGENVEPQAEKENAAYYAEQYYENLKEKDVINEQNSKEEQETEELKQEVTEELKGDQESSYKSDELEEEANNEASKEIISTEEFEYLWGVREKLDREGKLPEEIEEVMHEAEEIYETLKNAEKLYEEQQQEKLKLVDHEDEASEEDLKEDLDRVDLVEQAVELEEILVQQGKSQEEIDTRVEKAIETTKFEEKLDAIESESEDKKDFFEENTKLGSEESDEEEDEHLQELYRQETGRRPIYSRKKTIGYSQWLEQRELEAEKIKISKSESEEIKEEDWKTTLKEWMNEASEEECNAELKSELKKTIKRYNEFEGLTRKFLKLYEKSQYEKLSEKEKNRLKSLTKRLQELDPIQFELLTSVFFIKKYITEQYWHDFWNRPLVNRVLSKFFKHISKKYKFLKQEMLKLKELINANDDIIPEETQSLVNKEMETPNIPNITLSDPIGKNSTYIKNSFLWEYIKTRDKNILNEHTTIDLLADLYIEINRYPQILASIFPDRVNRFPERELSVIWGKYETFITKWKRLIRDNKQEGFRDEDLELLRINLKRHLGNKAGNCSKIINLYKSGKLTYIEFIDQLTKELGRYSYRLPLTMEEFSLILGGYVNFTNDILGKINNPSHQRYNPNYKYSIERLDDIKDNIQTILGDKAKKIFKIIRKYKNFNPDLKKYKRQQHTIDNPRFFKIIDLILTAYLFGFMCADGYRASKSYRIGIELKSDDKDRLILFAKSIGLDINRIRSRVRFYHINGVLKSSQMSVLSFICKDMHNDLANNQYSSSKADRKYIPNCILDAIHKAKQEALEMGINWMDTYLGMVALAWLLGYYDGDGTLDMRGNQMSARIYSASKQFLEQIREAFGIRNNVLTNTEPGEVRIVFGKPVVSRGYYLLTLGVKVFIGMLHSFSDSMQRKRPLKYRNSTD